MGYAEDVKGLEKRIAELVQAMENAKSGQERENYLALLVDTHKKWLDILNRRPPEVTKVHRRAAIAAMKNKS